VEKSKNMLGLVQDDTLYNYSKENPNTNVRYITMLGLEQITVITLANSKINSWSDIIDKRIGTFSRDSGSYRTLEKLLQISSRLKQNSIVPVDNTDKIVDMIVDRKIDLFFGIVSNPDPIFIDIAKKFPIKIIGIDGIDKKLLKIALPYYTEAIIDSTDYRVTTSKTIHTLQTGISLVCHKDLDELDSYLLIKTLFGNFSYIKNNGSNLYKSQMFEFNPTYLYNVNYSVSLHSGIRKYLKDINLITTNSNEDCIYKIGVEQCKLKYINGYRLI
jgi:TRAP transporter TAXI family solute receptor